MAQGDNVTHTPQWRRLSARRLAVLSGLAAGLVAGMMALAVPDASAATLFTADFESGSTSGWSKSGGTWNIVSDGTQVFEQSDNSSNRAREFAGSSSWTNYSVQARVKPLSFNGSNRVVALASRVSSSTKMYRLALINANRVELQSMNGSTVTVIASASLTVSTGTWYTLRIDASGSTISGYVNGSLIGSGGNSDYGAGNIGLFTEYASAHFDDVSVSDSSTAPSPSPTTASPPASPPASPTSGPTGNPPPTTGLIGWATQAGGTTGGAGGATVTVSNLADLTAAVAVTAPEIIRVNGNFSCSDDVRLVSNKTILGVGSGSGLTGCGLNMRNIDNIIVRNMNISKVLAGNGNGDAIHIDHATHLWIDHNDLSSDMTHGTDYYDGLLDITHAADYVTVSWNKMHDHIKCSLVGHSDSNASEDTGHLRVTYHHNYFSNCAERNPRVRFGNPVHVFNNYYTINGYSGYTYGVASTCNAGVLVEGNYFENETDPTHTTEGSSPAGNLVERNNYYVNSGTPQTRGSVAAIPYSYSMDPASSVKSIVTSGAGTGKIST
jgi:pectate lyase